MANTGLTLSGLRNQGTFAYSPDLKVLIANDTYGILDVSNDIDELQCSRNVNQISTLTFTLNNKYKKYDRRIQRMDRVIVFLKRTTWVQTFSGYITIAPFETVVPGAVSLEAKCTIKKLVNTYWDAGTQAAQALLPGFFTAQNTEYQNSDKTIVTSIVNVLEQVGNWKSTNIHIQGIPLSFLEFAVGVAKNVEQSAQNNLVEQLAIAVDVNGVTAGINQTYNTGLPSSIQPVSVSNGYTPALTSQQAVWRVGQLGTNDPLSFINDITLAQYEGSNSVSIKKNTSFISNASAPSQFICTGPFGSLANSTASIQGYWGSQKLLILNTKKQIGAVVLPVGSSNTNQFNFPKELLSILKLKVGEQVAIWPVSDTTPVGTVNSALIQGVSSAVSDSAPYSSSLNIPTITGDSSQAQTIVRAAQSQIGKPYIWGGGHGSLGGPGIGFDCSGLAIYAMNSAGIKVSESNTAATLWEGAGGPPIGNNSLQPGDLVYFWFPNDGNGNTYIKPETVSSSAIGGNPHLTPGQIAWLAKNNGILALTDDEAYQAAALTGGQSDGYVSVTGYNSNGSFDRGLWQINDQSHPETASAYYANSSVYTAMGNAQAMATACGGNAANLTSANGPWYTYDQNGNKIAYFETSQAQATYAQAKQEGLTPINPEYLDIHQVFMPSKPNAESSSPVPSNWQELLYGASSPGGLLTPATSSVPSSLPTHVEIYTRTNPNGAGTNWMIGADSSNVPIRYSQLTTYVPNQSYGNGFYMGATRPSAGSSPGAYGGLNATVAATPSTITVDSLNPNNALPGSPYDTVNASGFPSNINLNDAFNNLYVVPTINPDAQLLWGSPQAFVTDTPLIQTIQQLCGASMRHFMSAPNGDFVAWFPDYFGLWGQTATLQLRDIEVTDFKIYANDDQITTHVGVAGDPFGLGQGVSLPDWLSTSGIVSVQQDAVMQMLWRQSNYTAAFDANAFLNRYGMRPYISEVPSINDPLLEYMFSLLIFFEKWADQYTSTIATTFMPEVYPGMRIALPDHNLEVYVEGVTHTCSRLNGFETQLNITAPVRPGNPPIPLELTSPEPLDARVQTKKVNTLRFN